ncbi:DUF4974 domain-containing protein [Chitinophaga sp. G-6-1-13]|uniref:DUF4974 domain-containing protein n=1 Tax=Chitinophaga fulva TaxID=2728842 RepID=A0A848GIA8_9BACT|nr:FecR family protein [Chitinophaga fulva]NML38164.1 DUF4974 domain-containing protein [Chitinophaga fulva]
MQEDRLNYLFHRAIDGRITPAERQELHELLADPGARERYDELFAQLPDLTAAQENMFSASEAAALLSRIAHSSGMQETGKKKPVFRLKPVLIGAAASLALLLSVISYRFFIPSRHTGEKATLAAAGPIHKHAGVTLVLADGRQVTLDTTASGRVIDQQGTQAVNSEKGTLTYIAQSTTGGATTTYNTLSTPRGKHFKVVLPDGTRVWLNASSSLRYPTLFNNAQRKVELDGEAYFEVAKDANRPFLVATSQQAVRVLGTSFNVKAYTDEPYTNTSLVEGSISIEPENGGKAAVLAPGEQATLENSLLRVKKTDPQEGIAWMSDLFYFSNTELSVVLHQLQRWYDVEVDFSSLPAGRLYGQLPRSTPLPQLLSAIEKTSNIKFKLNNDRLSVDKQ